MFSITKGSKKKQKRRWHVSTSMRYFVIVCILAGTGFFVHFSLAARGNANSPIPMAIDPNIGIKPYVEEFFTQNDAKEMLSIINCESGFKQFDEHGEVLKNKEGSSAVGITQIIASKHPDQKVLDQYNKQNNTNLVVNDFDITTLMGNVGYALVLYKVRGTRDWECAKK